MRFRKGDKVEVYSNKEVVSGSWRCAEIICGNGHNYTVRFNTLMGSAEHAIVEKVPRKAIRPLPPQLVTDNWVPHDVIEVYDNFSWKIATVLKVLEKKCYVVRFARSTEEFRVHISDIRPRQSWKDEKWVVVGKGNGDRKDGKSNNNLILKYSRNSNNGLMNTQVKLCAKNDCLQQNYVPESQDKSCRTLKRGSPYGLSKVEAYTRSARKYRAVEKDGMRYQAAVLNTSSSLEQVDAIGYPLDMPNKVYKHTSNNKISGFSDMYMERRSIGGVGCSSALNLSSTDDDRNTCSVGSCSATSTRYYKFPFAVPVQDSDDHVSDAESVCPVEHKEGNNIITQKEDLRAEVHKLELQAYRCTIDALHVAGPLSWEQEVMLTNLRVFLNISDDEHLMVVRKLVSSGSSVLIS